MANRGQPDFAITVTTTSATAAFRDISQQVLTFNGWNIEAVLQQSDAFGDAWREHLYTGIRQMDDLTLGGFYEDTATATGVNAIFGNATDLGAEREMELNAGLGVVGASEISHFDIIVKSYKRQPTRGELTAFELVVTPTGAVTTAT